MKKSEKILKIIFPVFALFVLLSFSQNNHSPESIISERYTRRHSRFLSAISEFRQALKKGNKQDVRQAYTALRRAMKQWEYLGEYKHPALFKEKINGAPLPKMEENSFGAVIIEPSGMQVIDEYMGNLNEDSSLFKLQALSISLQKTIDQIPNSSFCYDHEIMEACRMELIRLFTLGLNGFDTPGTLLALDDAQSTLNTLKEDINLFLNQQAAEKSKARSQIISAFDVAEKMLKPPHDFNKFDRAAFLTGVINPLYSGLLDLQNLLLIPLPAETRMGPFALNYKAPLLFSNEFLNASYYSGLPEQFRTEEVKKLGMLLFFDPVLSENNRRACAGCHKPELAFTDGLAKSVATDFNGTVNRNSPTLVNCVFSERYFHDLRAEALEDQMTHVVTDTREFNTTLHKIMEKLKGSDEYVELFTVAFKGYGANQINPQTLSFAISAYVGSLNSFNSPFDKYARGESAQIDENIIKGFNLFMGKAACGTCHFAPLFSGTVPPDFTESESEVLGIPQNWPTKKPLPDADQGRAAARLKEQVDIYRFSFKTPGLRNIEKTAPYMHNGGMKSLEAVMDFYNKGGGNGIGLQFEHQTLAAEKLNLSKTEIIQIIAFMKSLTDYEGLASVPSKLPLFRDSLLNTRKIGGEY
jgi:cytochrome c peroxidase